MSGSVREHPPTYISVSYQNVTRCFMRRWRRRRRIRAILWTMSKVLLIDDDKKHSELLQAYFKRFGIQLVCAEDADEGFKKLTREALYPPSKNVDI